MRAHSGRARVSLRHPQAMGECDRCGMWWSLTALQKQMQWAGNNLADTGLLVCRECLDVPQAQFRSPILPQDPRPLVNTRPSYNVTPVPSVLGQPPPTTPGNLGFSQYILGATLPPFYPTTKAAVLTQVAARAGVNLNQTTDKSVILTPANAPVQAVIVQPARGWLLIYNPVNTQAQIALASTAAWGISTNLILGPGEAYFWSTDQSLGPVWTGALAASGLDPGMPLWIWEGSSSATPWLTDEFGAVITNEFGQYIGIP